jgi:drug/metabolite transporter (DMT)-like permease
LEESENQTIPDNGQINNMYYFGAVMGLVAAWARSVNFVSCKVLFKNKSTSSTDLIILYAGFGGLIVSLISSTLDRNSQILSSQFTQISIMTWGGMLATAVQCIIAVVSLNAALVVTGPVLVSFVRVNDIILAYFIQIVFFHQVPVVIGLVGSCCVVGAVICLPLEQLAVKFTPHFVQKIL